MSEMADKQRFGSKLKEETNSVVLNRVSTVSKEPLRDLVAKSLSRRKRKWKTRTKELTPSDENTFTSVIEERKGLSSTVGGLREKLVCKRGENIDQIRKLEYKRSLCLHQPLQERLEKIRDDIAQYRKNLTTESEESPPASTHLNDNILGDLEKAIFQVGELTKAQHMKFFVTPRVPNMARLDRRREQPHTIAESISSSSPLPQQDVADAVSSSVVGDYLPEDHLPAVAETVEASNEELNADAAALATSARTNTSDLLPEVREMEQTEEEEEECVENGLDSVFTTEEILMTSASEKEGQQNKQTLAEVHLNGTVAGGEELKHAKLRELQSELSTLKGEIEN